MRLVRPTFEKVMPTTIEPKMNHTDGSKKSLNASAGPRIMPVMSRIVEAGSAMASGLAAAAWKAAATS